MSKLSEHHFTVGSSPECTYLLEDTSVHNHHLMIIPISEYEYLIRDISNGGNTVVDRKKIVMARVNKHNTVRIGEKNYILKDFLPEHPDSENFNDHKTPFSSENKNPAFKTRYISNNETCIAGASPECDIFLPSPRIAWNAFKVERSDENWIIYQLHGKKEPIFWKENYPMKVGTYQVIFSKGDVRVIPVTANRLDLLNITVTGDKGTFLAKNLSLSVKSGEFVGIIGPSGAGKSVLLKTVRGIVPVRNGQIFLNSRDAYSDSQLFQEISFIPQDDVVYSDLTVKENIRFAAKFRLPSDWPLYEINTRVDNLIQRLYLTDCQDRYISKVSGDKESG